MKNLYVRGMDEIKTSESLKTKILSQSYQEYRNKGKHLFSFKAVACVLLLAVFILIINIAIVPSFLKDNGNKSASFSLGLKIYAFAADGVPIEVKPNIVFPVGKYSMAMSSVPGFPIKIDCDNSDKIELSVTKGEFLTWAPPDYHVYSKGNMINIKSGDTIYWSPTEENNTQGAAESSIITITSYDNNELIGTDTIRINSDGLYYSGELVR